MKQLQGHHPNLLASRNRDSAVGLILLELDEKLYFILVKRVKNSGFYSGNWCLPGGRFDLNDESLLFTAIREIEEEIGINGKYLRLLGQLDDFYAITGDRVRPFVFYLTDSGQKFILSQDELASYFIAPIIDLANLQVDVENIFSARRKVNYFWSLPSDDSSVSEYVWGLTASILVHFRNICHQKSDPIDKTISN